MLWERGGTQYDCPDHKRKQGGKSGMRRRGPCPQEKFGGKEEKSVILVGRNKKEVTFGAKMLSKRKEIGSVCETEKKRAGGVLSATVGGQARGGRTCGRMGKKLVPKTKWYLGKKV